MMQPINAEQTFRLHHHTWGLMSCLDYADGVHVHFYLISLIFPRIACGGARRAPDYLFLIFVYFVCILSL